MRRLKEAKGDEAGAATGAGAAKLQQQLEAARGLNISSLTAEVHMPACHFRLRHSWTVECAMSTISTLSCSQAGGSSI